VLQIVTVNVKDDMETQKYSSATRSELAQRYNVSMPTFKKWLDMIPNLILSDKQRTLTPKQVEIIFTHLGEPPLTRINCH
jgi:hypothetical protein